MASNNAEPHRQCRVPGCRRVKRKDGWCKGHIDPDARPLCPCCGGLRQAKSSMCLACALEHQSREFERQRLVRKADDGRSPKPKHATPDAMKDIRHMFKGCENRQGDKRFYTAQMARDLRDSGLITAAEARRLCPYM